jgi:hypothetical protein
VLELQEQTRQLQAEIDRLKTAARSHPAYTASPPQTGLAEQQNTPG